jgi:hypothetical protein
MEYIIYDTPRWEQLWDREQTSLEYGSQAQILVHYRGWGVYKQCTLQWDAVYQGEDHCILGHDTKQRSRYLLVLNVTVETTEMVVKVKLSLCLTK